MSPRGNPEDTCGRVRWKLRAASVLPVRWVLIFGGIAVFAVVLYALLGAWLWRRVKGLFAEIEAAERKLQVAGGPTGHHEVEPDASADRATHPGKRGRHLKAGAGHHS